MMDYKTQLKLQAFLDDELPENEKREMAARIARDSEAAALVTELRNTRQALKGSEAEVKVPESRDFYWSVIARRIESVDRVPEAENPSSLLGFLRRFAAPAGAIVALLVAGLIVAQQFGVTGFSAMETALVDSGAVTYRDQSEGMTLVWFSYPAEK